MSMINETINNNETNSEQVVQDNKVTNIWKQRAEDASKVEKIVLDDVPIVITKSDSNQDEKSTYYGKGKGKGMYQGKGMGKGKGKGYGKGKGEKTYQPKEQTPEEKIFYENKSLAFDKAQNIAIKRCLDRCNLKIRDDVNNSISHEINYKRTLVMDITDDNIIVEVGETNKYEFSFKRFLENRYFQNKLREEYSKILPEAWIRLFPGRDEGTFCIGIQKQKNF
jgi:hypothetical protein